ncbi:DUF4214 domain-containing protein [Oleiphilus messinensis]|nr:DUF4214 domain-containing protein [Oleiphilus messinensis]
MSVKAQRLKTQDRIWRGVSMQAKHKAGLISWLGGLFALVMTTGVQAATEESINAVHEIYVSYYGRPGDPAGVAFWSQVLDDNNGRLDLIINDFGTSAEYTERFGSLSTEALISNLYLQMFGREAEAAGAKFWADGINAGQVTLAQAAIEIAGGAQGTDLSTLNNRAGVAKLFTNEVEAQNKAYTKANITEARDMILSVDSNTDVATFDIQSRFTAFALPSENIKSIPAPVSTSNSADLAVGAVRGIKKAIANLNTTNATNRSGLIANGFGSSPTGILLTTELCLAGSANLDFNADGTQVEFYFNECAYDGGYFNGGMAFESTVDQTAILMTFTDFVSYDFAADYSSLMDGLIYLYYSDDFNDSIMIYEGLSFADSTGDEYYIEYAEITCTNINNVDLTHCDFDEAEFVDSFTGETYYIEDDEVVQTGAGWEASATVYDTEWGYIVVETIEDLVLNCSNGSIGGGKITFEGAEGSTGTVELVSCDEFIVTINGQSTTYNWSDFAKSK